MCVPILPNTAHPTLRLPMNLTRPLPWEDCYLSIFLSFDARVAIKIVDEDPPYLLSPAERVRLEDLMSDDRGRRIELYQQDHPGEQPPPLLPPLQRFEPEEASTDPGHEDDSIQNDVRDPLTDEEEIMAAILGDVVANETTPVVTCSYDFAGMDVLPDPKDFYKEVEVLDRCP